MHSTETTSSTILYLFLDIIFLNLTCYKHLSGYISINQNCSCETNKHIRNLQNPQKGVMQKEKT